MSTTEQHNGEALKQAIRAFTIEGPNDTPNGPAEEALSLLGDALEKGNLRAARACFERLCEHLADDTMALRIAAEAFFGGDFRAVQERGRYNADPVDEEEIQQRIAAEHHGREPLIVNVPPLAARLRDAGVTRPR